MILADETDVDRIKMNHNAKCLSQRSFYSKVIVRHTHVHIPPTNW